MSQSSRLTSILAVLLLLACGLAVLPLLLGCSVRPEPQQPLPPLPWIAARDISEHGTDRATVKGQKAIVQRLDSIIVLLNAEAAK